MFHRIVNRHVAIEKDLYLTHISHTSRNGNSTLFLRPHSSCNQHANIFFPWSIREWNKLPGNIVDIKDSLLCMTFVVNKDSGSDII